jgi:hypothetical protein
MSTKTVSSSQRPLEIDRRPGLHRRQIRAIPGFLKQIKGKAGHGSSSGSGRSASHHGETAAIDGNAIA